MVSRVAIVLLLGVAFATAGCDRGSPGNGQAEVAGNRASADEATGAAPAPSAAGTVDRSHTGESGPAVSFTAPDGRPTTLAALKGRPLLVNLWATWCAPCVKEMPTLDVAAKALGDRVRVIAVSQDMEPAKARAFFAKRGFTTLQLYLDPQLGLSLGCGANLPTTILYDAQGKEVWRVAGELDWSGGPAKTLLAEAG